MFLHVEGQVRLFKISRFINTKKKIENTKLVILGVNKVRLKPKKLTEANSNNKTEPN